MIKEIITYFSSLKEAEKYQSRLINKWDCVRLVQFPLSGESGKYVWHVKNKKAMNIIKLINNLRMISKFCAVGAFAVELLALCEYFGNPEIVELVTIFKWSGYSAVLAIFSQIMEIAGEEITNNI